MTESAPSSLRNKITNLYREHKIIAPITSVAIVAAGLYYGEQYASDGHIGDSIVAGSVNFAQGLPGVGPYLGGEKEPSTEGEVDPNTIVSHPVTQPPQTEAPGVDPALGCIAGWPIDKRIGETMIIGVHGNDLEATKQFFIDYSAGGAIIMSPPDDPDGGSINSFAEATGALIMTDEEGGLVQRFAVLGELPSAAEMATMPAADVTALVQAHGEKLKAIGMDVVLGPVLDVSAPGGTGPMAETDRAFSDDPAVVTTFGRAVTEGWQAAGLDVTFKHFPGLGAATGNTDNGAAVSPHINDMLDRDLVPYEELADLSPIVMMASAEVPGLTEAGQPATLSSAAYDLGRVVYADNLIVTDSLDAKAITNPMEAMSAALDAGADMVMMAGRPLDPATGEPIDMGVIVRAYIDQVKTSITTGVITDAEINTKVARVYDAKGVDACTVAIG